MRTPMMFFVIVMAVIIGAMAPIGAAENNKTLSGKQLPRLVKEAVKGLQRDIPNLSGLPEGYAVSLDDIKFVRKYKDLGYPDWATAVMVEYQIPAVVAGNSRPIFIVEESLDYRMMEDWASAGYNDTAVSVLKSTIAHEILHFFQETPSEESLRVNEIAGYELQLQILRRDIDLWKIPTELKGVTVGVELSLKKLRAGDDLAKNGLALVVRK